MGGLSVIIPSKTERFLWQTVRDVLHKATGELEVLVGLDGYQEAPPDDIKDDARLRVFTMPASASNQKRQIVNAGVEMAKGEYVMSCDAHIMFAEGFDEQLIQDHQENWVQVPKRGRLDAENWCQQIQYGKPQYISQEYWMWRSVINDQELHGYRWDSETERLEREGVKLPLMSSMQASLWFMSKAWFKRCGFMQVEGYSGWGGEEAELSLGSFWHGGELRCNRSTAYYHLHKGKTHGRMYRLNRGEATSGYKYSFQLWAIERHDFFVRYINQFPRFPNWPSDWPQRIRSMSQCTT
jgi:hypothetical protein